MPRLSHGDFLTSALKATIRSTTKAAKMVLVHDGNEYPKERHNRSGNSGSNKHRLVRVDQTKGVSSGGASHRCVLRMHPDCPASSLTMPNQAKNIRSCSRDPWRWRPSVRPQKTYKMKPCSTSPWRQKPPVRPCSTNAFSLQPRTSTWVRR